MASRTEIANLGLGRIGVPALTSLDTQTDDAAVAVRSIWDAVRDDLLRQHDWNFARTRVRLTRLTATPAFGFDYYYALPSDFVRVVEVNGARTGWGGVPAYEVESYGSQLVVATDVEGFDLVYIRRVTSTGLWDASFTAAFALKLAVETGTLLTGSRSQYAHLLEEYERLRRARAMTNDARDARGNHGKVGGAINGSALVASRTGAGVGSGYQPSTVDDEDTSTGTAITTPGGKVITTPGG